MACRVSGLRSRPGNPLTKITKKERERIVGLARKAYAGEPGLLLLDRGIRSVGYCHGSERMAFKEICKAFGVSRQAFSDWRATGCPQNDDARTYDLAAVVQWRRDRDSKHRKKSVPDIDMEAAEAEYIALLEESGLEYLPDAKDPHLTGGTSFYQELGRKRAAELARLKIEHARGDLISREEVSTSAAGIGNRLRALFELMEKHFGSECGDMLRTGLDDIEKEFPG